MNLSCPAEKHLLRHSLMAGLYVITATHCAICFSTATIVTTIVPPLQSKKALPPTLTPALSPPPPPVLSSYFSRMHSSSSVTGTEQVLRSVSSAALLAA